MKHIFAIILCLTVALSVCAQKSTQNDNSDIPEGSTAYYELNIRDLFRSEKWHDGKMMLDSAINKYPQMSAFHELMGRYHIHEADLSSKKGANANKSYDQARYYLIKAINIDEKNVRARELMLQVETDTKHYSSAIVYANELLEENPYNQNLWRKKIDLYRKLGNNAEADRLLERLATIYPSDEQVMNDVAYRLQEKANNQHKNNDRVGQEESLRQLIKLQPNEGENYILLANLLYSTGRIREAADIAGQGAAVTGGNYELVRKRVGMLCEMNKHREAVEYVKNCMKKNKSGSMRSLLSQVEADAARASQYNDPFLSYAKVYESQHSQEALTFLLNTAIQRNYFDDALYYIKEMRKRQGDTFELLYKEYVVNKRMGNRQRALSLLERLHMIKSNDAEVETELAENYLSRASVLMDTGQYTEALQLLELVKGLHCDAELLRTAALRRFNCYLAMKQYVKAENELVAINAELPLPNYIQLRAMLLNSVGRTSEALELLMKEYNACPEHDVLRRQQLAATYEEYAVPYIKNLMSRGMTYLADAQLQKAMDICPASSDILHLAISTSLALNKREELLRCVVRGRNMFPDDPFFIVKDAQVHAAYGEYREALNIIRPLLDVYVGDSIVIGAHSENSERLALDCLKQKHPYEAMAVVDSALIYDAFNHTLLYTKGLVYEKLKDYKNAAVYLGMYKPSYAELSAHNRHLEDVHNKILKNSLSFEYQQARLGSEDAITGNAYLTYAHKTELNEYSLLMSYAGRDGTGDDDATDLAKGGTGVQVGAAWQHQFSHRLALKAMVGWATKYFPTWTVRLSGTYDLPHDWQLSARASWRKVEAYRGVYEKTIASDGKEIDAFVGWTETKESLWTGGLGLSKTLQQFVLSGGVDGFRFFGKYYVNGNAKVQFFPLEGSRTHFFASGGVGTAPESSFIDRSLPVGFDDLNTFVGMGGHIFLNRSISLGFDGTWYTLLNQSASLTTGIIQENPNIRKDYKNYFYAHVNVVLSF